MILVARKHDGPQGLNQAVKRLNNLTEVKGKAIGIATNVADNAAVEALVGQVRQLEGRLDILVANAGATWGGPFATTPDWSSQKVLDLNVRGTFNLARL